MSARRISVLPALLAVAVWSGSVSKGALMRESHEGKTSGRLVFERKLGIFILDLQTRQVRKVSAGMSPRWPPDGTRIAYEKFVQNDCGSPDCTRIFIITVAD